MPVGTTADFDLTRNEVIDLALGLVGVSEPTQNDYTLSVKVLNSLVRHLDAMGDFLHGISNTESTLTTVASQQSYATGAVATTIATNILKLEYAAVLEGTDRLELYILDKPESLRTPLQNESNSEPVAAYLNRQKLLASNTLLLYPTPNAVYTIKYKYRRPLFDFDNPTDNPDLPSVFCLSLQKLLAAQLAPHYGTPLPERQLLIAEGEKEFQEALSFNADRPAYLPLRTEYF